MADQQVLPPVKGGLTPYLTVDGAIKAGEFYKKAFAADVAMAQPPDEKGRTMHVHLYINGSSLMLSDAYPDQGHQWAGQEVERQNCEGRRFLLPPFMPARVWSMVGQLQRGAP